MLERLVQKSFSPVALILVAALGAACGGDNQPLGPLPVTTIVNLGPAGVVVSDSLGGGAVGFPAAGAAGAEYLIVAQLTGLNPGQQSTFGLSGQASLVAMPLTRLARRTPNVAEQFHGMLRMRERDIARRVALSGDLIRSAPAATPPPIVGHQRTFKVCANLQCSSTTNVPATAQFVGAHAAIYTDNANPANGFTVADLATLGQEFDDVLYPIDTDRFGAESDIDNNSVVVVLLSRQINALVPKPECNNAFIAGYFFGGDLDPNFAASYNNGEVFYGMAPDPAGSATACAYSTTFVKRILPVTFIHEFQHMISFNQHVMLRGGAEEVLWLNEAMSHLAEELGGLHYESLGVDTSASRFYIGNLYNAFHYLRDPGAHAVVTELTPGSLEERGGQWLLLRYLVDRFGPTVTRTLTQTALTGEANLQAATGTPFGMLLGHWMLANYLSDLPGFTAPATLSYAYWDFRFTYGDLNQQDPSNFPLSFPLRPDSGSGQQAATSGTVSSGSGSYLRVTQPANGPAFSLAFRTGTGAPQPAGAGAQLAIARIR